MNCKKLVSVSLMFMAAPSINLKAEEEAVQLEGQISIEYGNSPNLKTIGFKVKSFGSLWNIRIFETGSSGYSEAGSNGSLVCEITVFDLPDDPITNNKKAIENLKKIAKNNNNETGLSSFIDKLEKQTELLKKNKVSSYDNLAVGSIVDGKFPVGVQPNMIASIWFALCSASSVPSGKNIKLFDIFNESTESNDYKKYDLEQNITYADISKFPVDSGSLIKEAQFRPKGIKYIVNTTQHFGGNTYPHTFSFIKTTSNEVLVYKISGTVEKISSIALENEYFPRVVGKTRVQDYRFLNSNIYQPIIYNIDAQSGWPKIEQAKLTQSYSNALSVASLSNSQKNIRFWYYLILLTILFPAIHLIVRNIKQNKTLKIT